MHARRPVSPMSSLSTMPTVPTSLSLATAPPPGSGPSSAMKGLHPGCSVTCGCFATRIVGVSKHRDVVSGRGSSGLEQQKTW